MNFNRQTFISMDIIEILRNCFECEWSEYTYASGQFGVGCYLTFEWCLYKQPAVNDSSTTVEETSWNGGTVWR